MTDEPMQGGTGFVRESSRIGINLIALVVSRFLCLGLTLVQLGIIFHALGVGGSGQFGFALNYPALFTAFATLGIQRLLVRDIARDPSIAWTYVWTAVGVIAALSAIVLGVVAGSIFAIESNPMIRGAVIMAALSVIVLWALQSPFEALLMAKERMVPLAVVYFVAGGARLAGTYAALRLAPTSTMAHAGIALGNGVGFLLCVAVAVKIVGWERPHFRPRLAWMQIRESLPFTVAGLFSMIYFKSDMSILERLQGESAAGIYTWAQRVMEPLLMVAGIWGTAVFPALCRFSVNAPDNYVRLKKMSARLALLVAFPMAFGVGFLARPILVLLTGADGAALEQAVFVLRVLCVVVPFFYINGVAQEFLYASHHNWFVVSAYGIASVISVTANLLCIPMLGVPSVAYTAIAANLVISVLFVRKMRSEYGAMHLVSLVAKTLAACLVMGLAAHALAGHSLVAAIGAGIVIYPAIQLALRTLTPEERTLVNALAAAPLRRFRPRS